MHRVNGRAAKAAVNSYFLHIVICRAIGTQMRYENISKSVCGISRVSVDRVGSSQYAHNGELEDK